MNLTQITRWQNLIGRAGTIFFALLFLILLDGLVARFREPANVIKALPGTAVEVNGPLAGEVKAIGDLTYRSDSPFLELTFLNLHKGYFLGGDMWRGQLQVGRGIGPGEYQLTIIPRGAPWPKPLPPFRVIIFADAQSRQAASRSWVQRYTGHSSWAAAASMVPLILICFVGVFLLSQRRDALLAQEGQAEIYRITRGENGFLVGFGLGTDQGIKVGDRLTITDAAGRTRGVCEVQEVAAADAWALVPGDQEVEMGFLVSRGGR